MGHFMAHDHGDFVVGKLQLVDDARVEGDLAARHAEGIDLLAADQVDLPAPGIRTGIPLRGVRDQPPGDGAQALQLRVVVTGQRALGAGLGQQLLVLVGGRTFQRLGRHQLAQARGTAHLHLGRHRRRGQAHGRRTAGQQKAAAGAPGRAGTAPGGRGTGFGGGMGWLLHAAKSSGHAHAADAENGAS
jgi:hypothetical protein